MRVLIGPLEGLCEHRLGEGGAGVGGGGPGLGKLAFEIWGSKSTP